MRQCQLLLYFCLAVEFIFAQQGSKQFIRINQLGYTVTSLKIAVWCSKEDINPMSWSLHQATTHAPVTKGKVEKPYGAYGPFKQSYRINFSFFKTPGQYYLKCGKAISPVFTIDNYVYDGAADFCLRYMRQQRTGYNPSLNDSCHTHDGFSMYGKQAGIKDSTFFDVTGGWHDASDYLQYSTTSANATYQLLLAYRDFPAAFKDGFLANGLPGTNHIPDVVDEANWGLNWLLKMFPAPHIMFNQIADDRDHISMRMPAQDSQYGRGFQRPVYFINGNPQQRGKFLNHTTGTSSTAAKFSSAFALASAMPIGRQNEFLQKSKEALTFALQKPGVTQTVSIKSPYIYAEDNWVDDMELAYASLANGGSKDSFLIKALTMAGLEPVTPWLINDTANHYQWYPFVNLGHYELLRRLKSGNSKEFYTIAQYVKQGINAVWKRAQKNAFLRSVPFIWCSNNLTVALAQQCYWYRTLTGDKQFMKLEQSLIDWLFGCNPWGTSMVYGLPAWGDTPVDPHAAFTHIKKISIGGGLVDGPVYTNIYKNLIGISLHDTDEYAAFQSDLAVYHDDYGDYSTNEPTMDGTASLIYLLAAKQDEATKNTTRSYGGIVRGDSTKKQIALIFSAHDYVDGASFISHSLKKNKVKASFFFTGDCLSHVANKKNIIALRQMGHYIGPHSNGHLLYAPWENRNTLLVTKDSFVTDLTQNYKALSSYGISRDMAPYFLPPFEYYNDSISYWCKAMGIQLINFTPGTISQADYTTPNLKNYKSSQAILQNIKNVEAKNSTGLKGYILLVHYGTDPARQDKFYYYLPQLISFLKAKGYLFLRVDELLLNK